MLKVKLINPNAFPPKKKYEGDAGFDVFAPYDFELRPGGIKKINLGFAVEFDPGNVLLVQTKSSLAEIGIETIGNVIDSTYRGPIHVIMVNLSHEYRYFKKGQKIAQLILFKCYTGTKVEVVDELSKTERGSRGFGSTGKFYNER